MTTDGTRALDEKFFEEAFPTKPAEKRKAWLAALAAEEYDTVDSLRKASDDAWSHMPLPLAIRDQLRSFISKPAVAPASAPAPVAGAPAPPATAPALSPTAAAVVAATAHAGPVVPKPIAQVDVIVFDVSSSMNSRSFEADKTRLEAGKILFQALVDKFVSSEFAHSLALLLFGERMTKFAFTRNCTEFENALGGAAANEGSTKLYDSILEAGRDILAFRKSHGSELSVRTEPSDPECCFRIFVLTDGEDNSSVSKHWEVAKFCQDNGIILDCIPLAGENSQLQQMAVATGGLCLRVADLERGVGLFEREAVLHVSTREKRTTPLPVIVDASSLSSLAGAAHAVVDVQRAVSASVSAPAMSAAAVQQAEASASAASSKRIFKEYRDAADGGPSHVPGVYFFINADDQLFWRSIIEGPADTPYEGHRFMMSVRFPKDYPFRPPDVRFVTPIYHCNVNADGRICLDILHSNWSPALSISKVMLSIQSLLANPNPDDPLDTYKAHIYRQDKKRYEVEARKFAEEHASLSVDELKKKFNIP